MDFDDTELLMQFIESSVEVVLRSDIAKMGVNTVKDILVRDLYSQPESDYYIRTDELMNSVIATYDDKFAGKSKKGSKRITIDHDTSRNFMPSGHRSWVRGTIQNSNIPFWVDGGYQGVLPNKFIGINYFDKSFNQIDALSIPTFIQGLRRFGIESYEA